MSLTTLGELTALRWLDRKSKELKEDRVEREGKKISKGREENTTEIKSCLRP